MYPMKGKTMYLMAGPVPMRFEPSSIYRGNGQRLQVRKDNVPYGTKDNVPYDRKDNVPCDGKDNVPYGRKGNVPYGRKDNVPYYGLSPCGM